MAEDRTEAIRARLGARAGADRGPATFRDPTALAMRAVSGANDDDLVYLLGEVDRLRAALWHTDEMLWHWSAPLAGDPAPVLAGVSLDVWRPLSVRERRRANAELLAPREVPDVR